MGICYIFGAAECSRRPQINKGDFVIAADGGFRHLNGIKPNCVVGDFDSLGYFPENENVVRHPIHKDDTDTMLAIKMGLDRGFDKFAVFGGLGGRLDHTIANIHGLAYLAEHGARGCLVGEGESVILLKNDSVVFSGDAEGTLSVFAYGADARGVTLTGLEYPLENATLTCQFPLGVSNACIGAPAMITVEDGRLLIVWSGQIGHTDWLAR